MNKLLSLVILASLVLSGCTPVSGTPAPGADRSAPPPGPGAETPGPGEHAPHKSDAALPYPERPRYQPGELVDYTAQTGDTLPGLAKRFNTTVPEILKANSFIPTTATTMPPGMPMKIPIYYLPLWGSPYQILPDSLFINGPAQLDFDTEAFVNQHPGWLKSYQAYVADATRSGANIVDYVAHYYSLSPRLLLTLLEYQSGALSQATPPAGREEYVLGYEVNSRKGLFLQLGWAANQLNDAYYSYRERKLTTLEHKDGRIERIDPWQNAATASLMRFFNTLYGYDDYLQATSADGLAGTYRELFGDPWANLQSHIPGSLEQPYFILPFEPGDAWAVTGGPHTAWGTGEPLAAMDFAPPSKSAGCVSSDRWVLAMADGVIVRSTVGEVMLDLDGDGDERTGWNIFYMHLATLDRIPLGAVVKQGDRLGHPSCEGGSSTGTHTHIARKYNGEWMPAAGMDGSTLAFNLEGWIAYAGPLPYLGGFKRFSQLVVACTCSNQKSWIETDRRPLAGQQK